MLCKWQTGSLTGGRPAQFTYLTQVAGQMKPFRRLNAAAAGFVRHP